MPRKEWVFSPLSGIEFLVFSGYKWAQAPPPCHRKRGWIEEARRDIQAADTVSAALTLFQEIGKCRIEERIHKLTDYLHHRLQAERFNIASPLNREWRSGITIVEMRNAPEIVTRLAEKKIIVSARGKGLRVSVHIFNNFDDVDRLIVGLRELSSTATANTA
jgi:selenocysteine lyase/cysteine desulfurase